jgi:hypothetical protein
MWNPRSITANRTARTVILGTALLIMPAHAQYPGWPQSPQPSPEEIEFYREMTIKAARMAVQDEAAKVKVTTLILRMGFSCEHRPSVLARPLRTALMLVAMSRRLAVVPKGSFIIMQATLGCSPHSTMAIL